jgi:uncharacterized protein YydD (DUF2326 family)
MIHKVTCDKPSFKTVKFGPGFNVVLAERTKKSKEKDSRNALGKSLLIEIIHFCLGSEIKKKVALGAPELKDWTFTLEITLGGKRYSISRNTKDYNKIFLNGDFSRWPINAEIDEESDRYYYSVRDWRTMLGYLLFDLPVELQEKKYKPTSRSLFSYFCRKGIGGYLDPFRHYSQQKEYDIQINNAYLLSLNWEYASEWQKLKDQEKTLTELKKAARQGLLRDFVGTIGELESFSVTLKEQILVGEQNLGSFKVHSQYHEIEEEIDKLTQQIHDLVNENNIANQITNRYNESIEEEKEVSVENIKEVFKEAGVIFTEKVTKRLDDVINFSKQISKNRKAYLATEIERLEKEIVERNNIIKVLSDKRATNLQILSTHGALDEYMKLQERHTELINQLREVEGRIENLQKFEEGKSALKIAREQLLLRARHDLQDRKKQKSVVSKYFNAHSEFLYSEPGILSIDLVDKGYKFNVEMKRSGSHGIEHMKVFCYDLSLMKIWSQRKNAQDFLIHDSMIYDGVDERQIAKALELAKIEAEKYGFQYICTMNSDMIPEKDIGDDFDFYKYVVAKFTDATADGGLLGFRF